MTSQTKTTIIDSTSFLKSLVYSCIRLYTFIGLHAHLYNDPWSEFRNYNRKEDL